MQFVMKLIALTVGLIAATPAYTAQDNKTTSDQRSDLTRTEPTRETVGGTATPTSQSAGTQGNSSNAGAALNRNGQSGAGR